MRVKVKITVRQIEAAGLAIDKKIREKRHDFEKDNPAPEWKDEQAWRKRHPSPREKYENELGRKLKPLENKRDRILLQARMERITEDQLFKLVEEF